MKYLHSSWLIFIAIALVVLAACAPAAAPPPAPTSAPPPPTAAPAQPTAVPPTAAPQPTAVPPTAVPPTTAPEPTAAPSGAADTIVWVKNIDDVVSMDPAEAYEFSGWLAVHSMYETLVKFEGADNTVLKPGLAEKWEIKDAGDNWELVFTLEDGHKFSSGNPVTAEDVVYSFQRAIQLEKPPSFLWTSVGGLTVDSITAPDAKTVVLKMPETASPAEFLNVLTAPPMGIVDSKVVKENEGSDMGNTWLKDHSAGSGPYMLDHWTKDVEYLLKANPNASTPPKTPNILVKHVPEAANQQPLLEKGDADIAHDLTPEQIEALSSNKDIVPVKAGNLQIFYVAMNANLDEAEPFKDNRVREAVRYAIDYEAIVNDVLSGNAQIIQGVIPNGLMGANTEIMFKRDVDKAKELMKEAGYENGFEMDLYTLTGNQGLVPMADVAAIIQANLADIGITLNVIQQPAAELLPVYRESKSPMVFLLWGPDYPDPNTNAGPFSDITQGVIAKRVNWEDKTAIEMAAKAKLEPDPAKRVELYKELTEYVAHNGPYAVVFQPAQLFGLRANIQGFEWNPMGFADLWTIAK